MPFPKTFPRLPKPHPRRPILARKHENQALPRKKSHTNPTDLLPEPATGNKGPDTNPLKGPPAIAITGHQVEFTPAPGKATHREMVNLCPSLQGNEGISGQ